MYVLMEKISRDAMRVDVPDVNPAGIDGTYIVKVRSSASAALCRLCLGRARPRGKYRKGTKGPTGANGMGRHGHLYGAGAGKMPSLLRASGLLVGQIDH